jgi:oligoribonuclease
MTRIFWIDMEMTGLDVEKEVILEVGTVITDLNFNTLETYHAVLKQPQQYLDKMDDWNQKHHSESGLLDLVAKGKDPGDVETELLALVDRHFPGERPVIAGNSIGQDRLFINRYMKRLADRLHYRMIDVTAWKVIMNEKFGVKVDKANAHRAIDDINESIAELKAYLSYVKVPSAKP